MYAPLLAYAGPATSIARTTAPAITPASLHRIAATIGSKRKATLRKK
jgi:hypothetical protein